MIDIHCLLHQGMNNEWFRMLDERLKKEPVVVHYIYNLDSIAEGRMAGYKLGKQPFVGFVDSDDLIEPGIFGKIIDEFRKGAKVVSCNEMLIDEEGKVIAPGVLLQPSLYPQWVQDLFPYKNINHHLFCFRRELLNPNYIEDSKRIIAEKGLVLGDCTYAAAIDIQSQRATLIQEVGYYYRRHKGQVTAWMNSMDERVRLCSAEQRDIIFQQALSMLDELVERQEILWALASCVKMMHEADERHGTGFYGDEEWRQRYDLSKGIVDKLLMGG